MMTTEEQAYVRKLEETIVKLEARIAELERRLNMNSSNSSKPPPRVSQTRKSAVSVNRQEKSPAVKADIRELP